MDEDHHAHAVTDDAGVSLSFEAQPDDRWFSEAGGGHPRSYGGGSELKTKAGVDVVMVGRYQLFNPPVSFFQSDHSHEISTLPTSDLLGGSPLLY